MTLVERNEKMGRKLYITGKGRCNVTNHTDARTVLEHIPHREPLPCSAPGWGSRGHHGLFSPSWASP